MSFLLISCKSEIDIFTEDIHFLTRENFIKKLTSRKTSRKSNFTEAVKEKPKATTRPYNLF